MNVIDLFAGCGGLSKGFMDAGFDIIVGVDNDKDALNTFALNHNGAKVLNADLSKQETFDEIKGLVGERPIDVIIAGPPCQGFSLTGPRNFDDDRNKLYLAVIKMVKQYRPKGFIIENVPGMATLYDGQIKNEILRRFRNIGYNIDCQILKACDYGVPQMRKRLIFMGIRKDIGEPHFPIPEFGPTTDKPYRTCREAISDLPTREDELGTNEDPDYTYSQFVGTYKPVSDEGSIKYEFIPGPFMRVFVDAVKSGMSDEPQPHILVIEEINRAKVAAVFGDVFQLLDRDDDGVSEYDIQTSEDIRKYLAKELGGKPNNYSRIRIPNNMFIWATMNSADQGVFPMDTAFKRRWNFEYLGINQNEAEICGKIVLGKDVTQCVYWNALRRAINEKLAKEYKVNEDKLMGPFFLSKKVTRTVSETDDTIADTDRFIEIFKSKVL